MDESLDPQDCLRLQIISGAMLAGTLIFLGLSSYIHLTAERAYRVPFVSYFALGVGLLAPVLAAMMDRAMAARPADGSSNAQRARQRHLVSYGILEGAGLACAFSLFLTPDLLPLAAALVPVGAMVLRFPRSS
jgi:hypothetical protein